MEGQRKKPKQKRKETWKGEEQRRGEENQKINQENNELQRGWVMKKLPEEMYQQTKILQKETVIDVGVIGVVRKDKKDGPIGTMEW